MNNKTAIKYITNAIKLSCDCGFHLIEFEKTVFKDKDWFISVYIYQHKSFHTGKLLKKPKLLADVVLNKEVANSLIESLNNGILK